MTGQARKETAILVVTQYFAYCTGCGEQARAYTNHHVVTTPDDITNGCGRKFVGWTTPDGQRVRTPNASLPYVDLNWLQRKAGPVEVLHAGYYINRAPFEHMSLGARLGETTRVTTLLPLADNGTHIRFQPIGHPETVGERFLLVGRFDDRTKNRSFTSNDWPECVLCTTFMPDLSYASPRHIVTLHPPSELERLRQPTP